MITVSKFLKQSKELQLRKLYRLVMELEQSLVTFPETGGEGTFDGKVTIQIFIFLQDLSSVSPDRLSPWFAQAVLLVKRFIEGCKKLPEIVEKRTGFLSRDTVSAGLIFEQDLALEHKYSILEHFQEALAEQVFLLGAEILEQYPDSGLESLRQDRYDSKTDLKAVEEDFSRLLKDWQTQKQRYLFLDNIRTPYNVGSIIRSACALGVDGVILGSHCPSLAHPRLRRAAMGTETRILISRIDSDTILQTIREDDIPLIALETGGTMIEKFHFPSWGLGVLGHEEMGISSDLLQHAKAKNTLCSIAMPGAKASLNVSVAAGIFLQYWSVT